MSILMISLLVWMAAEVLAVVQLIQMGGLLGTVTALFILLGLILILATMMFGVMNADWKKTQKKEEDKPDGGISEGIRS